MVWLIFVFMFLLIAALAYVFVVFARAIRRDVDQRFQRLQGELEDEARSLVRTLFNEDRRA